MNEPDWETATEKDVWEYVAVHLKRRQIDTVLVGGAVVAIYTEGMYQSGDLDLVKESDIAYDLVAEALQEIGFQRHHRHFAHPQCRQIFIEFVSGPPAIGDDYKLKLRLRKVGGVSIKILSPTDCIKDRLASYIFFKSQDALDQAVLVAQSKRHSLAEIKRWCSAEGRDALIAFHEFTELLRNRRKRKP